MSGDHGLRVTVPASLQALQDDPRLYLHLVGDTDVLAAAIAAAPSRLRERLEAVPAASVIPMDAPAGDILRGYADASLQVCLDLVAEGRAQGMVSAGNTTALMALGRRTLRMVDGFSRPAFCSAIPTISGSTYMLDLGANVDCSPENLHEFALLGSALYRALEGSDCSRLALLSNGSEASKGNLVIREAAQRLAQDERLNYCGFIEGNNLHDGEVGVIVCDGLLGNAVLKAAEGTADFASSMLRTELSGHWWLRVLAALSGRRLAALREALSADRHGGAFLLGLQGVVVKSHGSSSEESFRAALAQAAHCLEYDMVAALCRHLDGQGSEDAC